METTDKPRFEAIMNYLSLNFPERSVTPELIDSYFDDLAEYPLNDVSAAAKDIVQTHWQFPLVSGFVRRLDPARIDSETSGCGMRLLSPGDAGYVSWDSTSVATPEIPSGIPS